jgi:acetoin utilization protein AcuB
MYVKLHMNENPITVGPEVSISEAREILQSHHFRHLPVVNQEGEILGMITDRDIRSAYPSTVLKLSESQRELEKVHVTPVAAIMSTDVVSLGRYSTLDDALLLLDRERVGALPVLDEQRRVIGVFSIRDLLRAYNQLFGVGEKGSALIALKADGAPRPLSRIIYILEENDIHFSRVVRTQGKEKVKGHETIYIRVNTFNIHAVHKALTQAGFDVER